FCFSILANNKKKKKKNAVIEMDDETKDEEEEEEEEEKTKGVLSKDIQGDPIAMRWLVDAKKYQVMFVYAARLKLCVCVCLIWKQQLEQTNIMLREENLKIQRQLREVKETLKTKTIQCLFVFFKKKKKID
ncbi:hypothetical protein RFI_15589, partial [Reticulomyxa filosa]